MKFHANTHAPGLVYDDNNILIPFPIEGDTETGEVVVSVRKEDGSPKINFWKREMVRETRQYKPPLRLVPIPEGWVNPYL